MVGIISSHVCHDLSPAVISVGIPAAAASHHEDALVSSGGFTATTGNLYGVRVRVSRRPLPRGRDPSSAVVSCSIGAKARMAASASEAEFRLNYDSGGSRKILGNRYIERCRPSSPFLPTPPARVSPINPTPRSDAAALRGKAHQRNARRVYHRVRR